VYGKLTLETSVVFDVLGIDVDDLDWQDLSICVGQPVWRFYDGYETNNRTARLTDEMCLSCPVRKECLQAGVENSEWGVWGGIYLENGKPSDNKNAHKTQDTWDQIREGIA
jgi:hypothetical protein